MATNLDEEEEGPMRVRRWWSGCGIVFASVVLAFFSHAKAQPVDPLLDEAVQILIEKHEIIHLQKIGQLDPAEAQQRLQANKQRWDQYSQKISQKIGQLPNEKQQAFADQLNKRKAAAFATLQQKWDAEARQLPKDGSGAQAGQQAASTAPPAQTGTGGAKTAAEGEVGPDVLGIKLGISTAADVRAALAKVTPSITLKEQHGQLVRPGRPVLIEGTEYLTQLRGVTSPYGDCGSGVTVNLNFGSCEIIEVKFSARPNAGTALSLIRTMYFVKGPSLDTMTRSLVEKYGEPGFHGRSGDFNVAFTWAWSTEGKPISLNAQHPCVLSPNNDSPTNIEEALRVGCAAVVQVVLTPRNNVVDFMTVNAINNVAIQSARTKTSAWIADYVANEQRQEREGAAKIKAPGL